MICVALLVGLIAACSDDDSPTQEPTSITTMDDLLARVCELGGECGGSSQADIEQCPANLLTKLGASDLAELEDFLGLSKSEQDRILDCFAEAVCGRFGGSVLNMSDSDLMEPFRACE